MRILRNVDDFRSWMAGIVPGLKATITAGLMHLRGKMANYPPAPIYSGNRGYLRGSGPWYRRKNGSIRQYKTSEDLGPKWAQAEPTIEDDGLTGRIGNNASYGPFVQGAQQAAFHKARGWQTVGQVVERETPAIIEFFRKRLIELLGGTP